jgi:surfactin synthase thioesterase subunit/glycosyltransferase involved in cell wall biosynthesis
MRILLGANALYYPAHGGGERSNRMVMEGLAARGHTCFVITRIERFGTEGDRRLASELGERGITPVRESGGFRFHLNGVEVLTATTAPSFRAFFVEHKNLFQPDVIITSTDDPAQLLLEAALHDEHAPTVFLTRATVALPFGPDAAFASREKTEMLAQADGVVGVSNYVASYIRQHSGIEAIHVPIAPADPGPHPKVGSFDNPFVTLVNPCAVKGIKLFLELAKALPHVAFAGVPTWGTTPEDVAALRQVPNITVLPKVDQINDLLRRTRVLLAPSVWAEARSRIVVEAMLAGVPVMASNLGGLPEAKMGIPYILPVTPIRGYRQRLDEQFVPIADVPEQDIAPWREALVRLTSDRAHWEEIAQQSRSAALHYAETATVDAFAEYLSRLTRRQRTFVSRSIEMPYEQLARLSPERRKLLELKLRGRRTAELENRALPAGGIDTSHFRLFCFPHAGGGAAFFRSFREPLRGAAELAPVQYPGHENRRAENYASSMQKLVESLLNDLGPALTGDFAFFGHSMGAVVAFELTRALRREDMPQPRLLIASGARAPQFRRDYTPRPDPSREELLDEVCRLEGLPDPEMVELILPSLEADTALYRRYVYQEEPPLAVPIAAVGGERDPNVNEHHVRAWAEQTTASFAWQLLPGGHFFLRSEEAVFLEWLRRCTAGKSY